jgi:hypothetical protein
MTFAMAPQQMIGCNSQRPMALECVRLRFSDRELPVTLQ